MMKIRNLKNKRILAFLLTLLLAVGCLPYSLAQGSGEGLTPADRLYDDGNIILSKTAERIGPEEWEVTVKATIKEEPIVRQGMEVVFVLDGSGSMAWCTDETAHNAGDHTHNSKTCYGYDCGTEEHTHEDDCYQAVCGNIAHTHDDSCYHNACGYEDHEHTISNGCYKLDCNLEIHTHQRTDNYRTNCYRTQCNSSNSNHWSKGKHIDGTTCIKSGKSYYQLTCTNTHTAHTDDCYKLDCDIHTHQDDCRELTCVKTPHTHEDGCMELVCTRTVHTHTDACKKLICKLGNKTVHSDDGAEECTYVNENGTRVDYESRIKLAKSTISNMVANLNKEFSEKGITFKYVLFSSSGYENNVKKSGATKADLTSFDGVTAEGGTYMYAGIKTGLDQFSADTGTKKMLVVITDGAANDKVTWTDYYKNGKSLSQQLNDFKDPSKSDGVVYTIGFSYASDTLNGIAGNGGKYIHASNADELTAAMSTIQSAITAMLVDPMGSTVGFTVDSVQIPTTSVEGSVDFNNNTLYWNPTGKTEFENATIEYSYIVSLNDNAGKEEKAYSQVALNAPTSLLYGVKNNNNTDMKSAAFPIPEADYAICSVQVNWKHGNTDIKTPTATEKIISDYTGPVKTTGGYYEPEFQTDYTTITQNIPQSGNNVYRYIGTTITRNGVEVDAVDPTDVAAYVVTHNYELEEVYEVVYEYTGVVPEGAPAAYLNNTYAKPDEIVTVADDPQLKGWQFSGWTVAAGNAVVENGQFTMPANDVKLVGSWVEKDNTYAVEAVYYTSVDGQSYQPDNETPEVLVARMETEEDSITYDFSGDYTFNGNTYTSVQLAQDSHGQLEGNTVTAGFQDETDLTIKLAFYREIFSDAKYTVTHAYFVTDPDGVEKETSDTFTTEEIVGKHGDVISSADIASVTTGVESGKEYTETSRTGDITLSKDEVKNITINYMRYEYRVEVEGDEGVATTAGAGTYDAGEDAVVTYTLKDGYDLVSITVDDENKTEDASALIFNKISANHKVVIKTQKSDAKYTVTHKYFVTDPDGVEKETSDTFTTEEIVGKHGDVIVSADIAAETTGASGKKYSETNRTEDITLSKDEVKNITINYMRYEYRVEVEGDEGVATTAGAGTYDAGENAAVTYTLNDGYDLVSIIVDDENKTEDASALTFDEIAANHKVVIKTQKSDAKYTVTHKYFVTDPDGVEKETSDTFTTDEIIGKHGDVIASADIAAETTGTSGKEYTETSRTEDITLSKDEVKNITINYMRYEYKVEVEVDEGIASNSGAGTYDAGEDAAVTYTLKDGYDLVSIIVDDENKTEDASALTFDEIAANHKVVIKTQKSDAKYTVTHKYFVTDPDGIVTETSDTFTTEEISGKHGDVISSADITAETTGTSGKKYAETSCTGDITLSKDEVKNITINYMRYEYKVEVEVDEGVASNSGAGTYDAGEDAAVTYTLKDGYDLVSIIVDDENKTEDASALTFDEIAANHKVVIKTQKSDAKYTVTHAYFVTDPDGNVTETGDTFTTATIGGEHGDVITTESITSQPIGTSGKQYEETARTEDITLTKDEVKNITISYMRYEYRVEVEGDEGVDTTSGAGTYEKGTDVVTGNSLKEGYDLLRVTVDGEDKTDDPSALTFNKISANHKVVIVTQKSDAKYTVTHAYFVTDPDGNVTETSDTFTTEEIAGKHGDVVVAADIAAETTGTSGKEYAETSRTEDITLSKDEVKNITINYMRYEYRVEVEGDEGVATTAGAGTYDAGEDAAVTYTLKEGYDLVSITVDGEDKTDDLSALNFNKISANHKVVIKTQKSDAKYTVTHAYFVTDPDGNVTETGDTFTTEEITGKHGDVVAASDIEAVTTGTSGKQYEETARTEDITLTKDEVKNITINYMRYEYRVEVEGDEGVATTAGAGTYDEGEDVAVTYTLKDGYDLVRITVDDENKTEDPSALTFNKISANHKVVIETQKSDAKYTVTHKYFVTDPDGVEKETSDTFTTEGISGKHGDVIVAADIAAETTGTSGKEYTETSRTGDITLSKDEVKNITINYMRYEYKVEVEVDEGVASNSGAGTYNEGENAAVTYTLKDGYEVKSITVDGVDKTDDASALTFNEIAANHKVVIKTQKSDAKYTVTHKYFVTDPDGVEKETSDTFTTEEISGKHGDVIASADITAETTGASGKKYTETSRSVDITLSKDEVKNITINYMRYEYRVEVEGDEGVATTTGAGTYDKGEDVAVTYTLKDGYDLVRITVDDKNKTEDPSALTFNKISANHKVVIKTQKSDAKYTVTHKYFVTDPDGVEKETSDTFTTEEIAGKHGDVISSADITAETTGASGKEYTETSRTEDITLSKDEVKNITINYMRYEYRVEVEGDEGVATTAGAGTYDKGEDAAVTYTLKDGYDLVSIIVDDENKTEDASALTFNKISANHKVVIVTQKSDAKYTVTHKYFVTDPDGVEKETSDTFTTEEISGKHGDVIVASDIAAETTGASGKEYAETSRTEDITLSKDEVKNITINYMRYEYRVEVEGDEGVATTTGAGTYDKGEDVAVTYTLKDGYELLSITVDGEDKTDDLSALTFNEISANHKVVITTSKIEEPLTAKAIVHYVDENGNQLREDTTTDEIEVGTAYDVSAAKSITSITIGEDTYDFTSDDTAANNTAYSGTMPENGVEITRVYTKREPEPLTAKAIVHYVDENGNQLREDTTTEEIEVGTAYDVSAAKSITSITIGEDTYDFTSDDTAANNTAYTGDMPEEGVEITRVYTKREPEPVTAKAIVHYVDENGNQLREDTTTEEIEVGTSYDVSAAKAITSITIGEDTYDFISDDTAANNTAYTGDMPEEGVEITRVYTKREPEPVTAKAIVHYVDENGNQLRDDTTTEEIEVGTAYDISTAESITSITIGEDTYDFTSDDTAANNTTYSGTMPDSGVEITRVYTKREPEPITAKAIVHYVDENGNQLREDTETGEIEVGTAYDVSEALAVETIEVDGREYRFNYHFLIKGVRDLDGMVVPKDSDYAGLMPEFGVEITRVYKLEEKEATTYYYSEKYVFTVYGADGSIVYSGMEESAVTATESQTATVTAPEAYHHGEYDFQRVSDESQTADLTGTTEERPHVFVTLYEVRLTEEPQPDEEETVIPELPPQTGDDGVMLWAVLMLCSMAGLALLTVSRRKQDER